MKAADLKKHYPYPRRFGDRFEIRPPFFAAPGVVTYVKSEKRALGSMFVPYQASVRRDLRLDLRKNITSVRADLAIDLR